MILPVKTSTGQYNIILKRGALNELNEYMNLNRKTLVVTDSGVPESYAKTVAKQCRDAHIITIPQGEESKNFDNEI